MAFIQRQDFVKHMKIHYGDNFYKCEICSEGFPKQSDLKVHYKVHYPDNDSWTENLN